MKAILPKLSNCALVLSALLLTTSQAASEASNINSIMNYEGRVPIVEGFGYTNYWEFLSLNDFGLGLKTQLDAYSGYKTDLFTQDAVVNDETVT